MCSNHLIWQFAVTCGFATWGLHLVPLIKIFWPSRACSACCPLCSWWTRRTHQQRRLCSIPGSSSSTAASCLPDFLALSCLQTMYGTFDGTHSHQDGWPSIRTTRLSMAQLTPRKHEVWTELVSAPPWQAKLRQDVAHAADNCRRGSLMCYDHHVGTHAVHLEFNCPQSAKSDSLQKLVALRHGYFTSCHSLKSSDHAAHAAHSVRCVPDGLAKKHQKTCQQRCLGSICGFLSPKLFSISFASHVCR